MDKKIDNHDEFLEYAVSLSDDIGKGISFLQAVARQEVAIAFEQIEPHEIKLDAEVVSRINIVIKALTNIQTNLNKFLDTPIKIRINQLKAITDLVQFLKNAGQGDTLGYFHQPTGGGKTILFGIILELIGLDTIILVPSTDLLDQTYTELIEVLGIPAERIGRVGAGYSEIGRPITIATYQSHRSKMLSTAPVNPYRKHALECPLYICDEAHKGIGKKTADAIVGDAAMNDDITESEDRDENEVLTNLNKYAAPRALKFGFTATPHLRDKDVSEIFKTLISHVKISALIAANILAKYKVISTEANLFSDEIGTALTQDKEAEILAREQIYDKLLDKFIETRDRVNGRLLPLASCSNIKECDKFANVAWRKGLKNIIVTSREGDVRIEAEQALLSGEIDLIITVDKLAEGWNFRPLNAVMIARATRSPARLIQLVGRAARAFPGKIFAYIFETNWSVCERPRSEGSEDPKKITDEKDEVEDSDLPTSGPDEVKKGKVDGIRNPLTLAQALYLMHEDVNAVCEGLEGENMEYKPIYHLDDRGIVTVVLPDTNEVIEVVGISRYAHHIGKDSKTLFAIAKRGGLRPITGVVVKAYTYTVEAYRKSDIDALITTDFDERGVPLFQDPLTGEMIEVVGMTNAIAAAYKVNLSTIIRRLKEVGIEPVGTLHGEKAKVYRKTQVDEALGRYCVDENGVATIKNPLTGESIRVIALSNQYTMKNYGKNTTTVKNYVKAAGIKPIEGVTVYSGNIRVQVYPLEKVDALFNLKLVDR